VTVMCVAAVPAHPLNNLAVDFPPVLETPAPARCLIAAAAAAPRSTHSTKHALHLYLCHVGVCAMVAIAHQSLAQAVRPSQDDPPAESALRPRAMVATARHLAAVVVAHPTTHPTAHPTALPTAQLAKTDLAADLAPAPTKPDGEGEVEVAKW